jgi:hypothetical protein
MQAKVRAAMPMARTSTEPPPVTCSRACRGGVEKNSYRPQRRVAIGVLANSTLKLSALMTKVQGFDTRHRPDRSVSIRGMLTQSALSIGQAQA